jgi:phenylacetate-coenzyme A ligase PaaK-like adenylate-forming protein
LKRTTVDALTARRLGLTDAWSRADLEAAQFKALRQTVRHARDGSAWHRDRLKSVDLPGLQSRDSLAGLPLMTAADLTGHGERMVCVPQGEVRRVVTLQTSGSTGIPKRLHFTQGDLDGTVDFFLHGMQSLVGQEDRVLALLPFAQPDSTGDLLIRALAGGSIHCAGLWPPADSHSLVALIREHRYSCVVGLPQHLLALAHVLPFGAVRTMLLCSDYAPPALRERIEQLCGCETFLHYGATETGLGGGVECSAHDGCHLRESDLLVEIVDPQSGQTLSEGQAGEVVVTTLNRQAMPLIRYRSGDMARLTTAPCRCGGLTARLTDIAGRQKPLVLSGGFSLTSQDLDDRLFAVNGLLDYRATVQGQRGAERLVLEFLSLSGHGPHLRDVESALLQVPAVAAAVGLGTLSLGALQRVDAFSPSHTVKRTIADQRGSAS